MAELAAVGVAESIISLVEVGWKVVKRVNEFRKAVKEVPKSLEAVTTQLPIYLDILKRASKNITSEKFNTETVEIIKPSIDKCEKDVDLLDKIVNKLLPNLEDSTMKKAKKAFDGVRKEEEIEKIQEGIWKAVHLLASYQIIVLDPLAVEARNVTSVATKSSLFLVPFERDEKFVGRAKELQEIEAVLGEQEGRMSLVGLGGIGKSQIAIEYCYRYRQAHKDAFIFWVYCSTEERFRQSYKDIARRLDLPDWNDPSLDTMQLVVEWLNAEDSPEWLIVMDNIDDLDLYFTRNSATHQALLNYLPQSKAGRLLLTSRDQKIWNRLNTKHTLVKEPNPDECVQLLRNKLENESPLEDEDKLVESLDYFPLLITQAGAFLNQTGITIAEYMELWDTDSGRMDIMEEDCGDLRRYATNSQHSNSVVRTWQVTFDLLIAKFPKAAELMSFMAMLDRHAIPSKLFEKGLPSKLERVKTIATLENFGFISANPAKTTFAMHRLVQLCTHRWLEQEDAINKWQMNALNAVSREFPEGWHANWTLCEAMLPHAALALTYQLTSNDADMFSGDLLANLGLFDYTHGRYAQADIKLCKALEKFSAIGDESRIVLAKFRLALTTSELEDFDRAVAYYESCLNAEAMLGPTSVLVCKSLLANIYLAQSRFSEAEKLILQVIWVQQGVFDLDTTLDNECFPTLLSQSTLAMIYKRQNRLKEAEDLLVHVIEVMQRLIGNRHPEILAPMIGLAGLFVDQGRTSEAECQLKKIMEIKLAVLGETHPATLSGLNDLVCLYKSQLRFEDCEKILRQALDIQSRTLGENHSDTLETMQSIVYYLRLQGKLAEARIIGEQILSMRKRVYGDSHKETLRALTNLGFTYQKLLLWEDAERTEVEFLKQGRNILGNQDTDILNSMENLANIYRHQGRLSDAKTAGERVVEERKKYWGGKHPDTLASISGLAETYHALGWGEDAEKLQKYGIIASDQTSWPFYTKVQDIVGPLKHSQDIEAKTASMSMEA